jgi:hypothetical protein
MASVTEEIKRRRNEPDQSGEHESSQRKPTAGLAQELSHRGLTQEEQDSGPRSVSHGSSAKLTGKLCRRVMALIRWKVGVDNAVTEHVVWAL